MEQKKLSELTVDQTPEGLKKAFDSLLMSGVLIIPTVKTQESKRVALAAQSVFAISRKQAYAMYINYITCGLDKQMTVRETVVKNGKLFIYGDCYDGIRQRNLVITMKMISKTKLISYAKHSKNN